RSASAPPATARGSTRRRGGPDVNAAVSCGGSRLLREYGNRLVCRRAPEQRLTRDRVEEVAALGVECEPDLLPEELARSRREPSREERASLLSEQRLFLLARPDADDLVGLDRGGVDGEEDEDLSAEVLLDGHFPLDRPGRRLSVPDLREVLGTDAEDDARRELRAVRAELG